MTLRERALFECRRLLPSAFARHAASKLVVDQWHALGCYPHPVEVPV